MRKAEIEYGGRRVTFVVPAGEEEFYALVCDEFGLGRGSRLGLVHADGAVAPFGLAYAPEGVAARLRVFEDAPADHQTAAAAPAAGPGGEAASLAGRLMRMELRPNHVVALYEYEGKTEVELTFSAGDLIRVQGQYSDGWWKGEIVRYDDEEGRVDGVGYFPANYVHGLERIRLAEEDGDGGSGAADPMQDEEYFDSYATLTIHHQMLHDAPRTQGYLDAVEALVPHIRGRVVMDIGCGSGILSMFCARAGAKHVYAVDASDIIHMAAAKNVRANGLDDRITLIKGKVEEIDLPVPEVDVIISEWMGTYMVCESMIESVLLARERFLVKDGTGCVMPSQSTLFLAPLCLDEYYDEFIGFWKDVYGFDMTCLVPQAKATFLSRPSYDRLIKESEVIGDGVPVWRLDLETAVAADLEEHESPFELVVSRGGRMHGFGAWFDVTFAGPAAGSGCTPVVLSTSPSSPGTHWKQVMFKLDEPIEVAEGQRVRGTIRVRRNAVWRRHFETSLTFVAREGDEPRTLQYEMWR